MLLRPGSRLSTVPGGAKPGAFGFLVSVPVVELLFIVPPVPRLIDPELPLLLELPVPPVPALPPPPAPPPPPPPPPPP